MIYLLLQDYSMTLARCIRWSLRSFIGGIICFYCYLDIFMGVQDCCRLNTSGRFNGDMKNNSNLPLKEFVLDAIISIICFVISA